MRNEGLAQVAVTHHLCLGTSPLDCCGVLIRASLGPPRGTAQWFGVGEDGETKQQDWQRKSLRHCSQRYGKLKAQYREPDTASSLDQGLDSPGTQRLPKVGR